MSENPPTSGSAEADALLASAMADSHAVVVLQREAEERERLAKMELARRLQETAEARHALQILLEEQKRVEAALRESEARWRFAMDGAGDGLWDWNVETGEVFYSRRWKEMLGYAEDELGSTINVWERLVHPDDLTPAILSVAAYFKSDCKTESHVVEHRMRCKDGSYKWILARGKVVDWAGPGKPRRMLGTHTDIDREKRQEQTQAALMRRLDLVMRASRIGVWEWDIAESRLDWDDAMHALYGMRSDEMHGSIESFRGCVHPEDRQRVDTAFQAMCAGVEIPKIEFRIVRRIDSATRIIEGNGYLIRGADGKLIKLLGMNRDITELKEEEAHRRKLEAQLAQAQKMETLGTLAGGIAHDFNNLLTGVIGCLELAMPLISKTHAAAPWLERARSAGLNARDLVKRLMLFSRCAPTTGRKPLRISKLVEDTLPILKASVPASIAIRAKHDSAAGEVFGDHAQLQQVLMNLCLNSAHAIGAKQGHIDVEVRAARLGAGDGLACAEGAYVCMAVADDGAGMDEATQARIFDPFFTTKPEGQGTGLGLSIVHGIVHDHGGAIRLRSAPGEGACFEVFLPVASESAKAPEAALVASAPLVGRGRRVLVVDDEEPVRLLVSQVLQLAGFEVELANDGEAGRRCFAAQPDAFALALVDLSMPGKNGLELIADIRAVRRDVPVILMSGDHNRYHAQAKINAGGEVEPFTRIQKPFTIEELKAAIRPLVETEAFAKM